MIDARPALLLALRASADASARGAGEGTHAELLDRAGRPRGDPVTLLCRGRTGCEDHGAGSEVCARSGEAGAIARAAWPGILDGEPGAADSAAELAGIAAER